MQSVIDWLSGWHPAIPWILLTVAIWAPQAAIRRWLPSVWEIPANLPFGGSELGRVLKLARKVWQGLPSVLTGAAVGAALVGENIEAAWKGALFGALAPLGHELKKLFGSKDKDKGGGGTKGPMLLVLALAVAVPALPLQGCAATAQQREAMVAKSAALAFNGAVVALELLDANEARRLDAMASPTPEQLVAAEQRVERLERARDALSIVRSWLSGERSETDARAALSDAIGLLNLVERELRADGVRVPPQVSDGLALASAWAGSAP